MLMFHSSPIITIYFLSFAFFVACYCCDILSIIIFLMMDFFPLIAFSPELLSSSPSICEYYFPVAPFVVSICSPSDDSFEYTICSSSSSYEYLILLFCFFLACVVAETPLALLLVYCSCICTLCYLLLTPFMAPERFPKVLLLLLIGDSEDEE